MRYGSFSHDAASLGDVGTPREHGRVEHYCIKSNDEFDWPGFFATSLSFTISPWISKSRKNTAIIEKTQSLMPVEQSNLYILGVEDYIEIIKESSNES